MTDVVPIIDLHCDLLVYLQSKNLATAYDDEVNCSIPQLRSGGVKTQICAIYATGDDPLCVEKGKKQVNIFNRLPEKYVGIFRFVNSTWWDDMYKSPLIGIMPAIESASALCTNDEPLTKLFDRLQYIEDTSCKIAYISLTWNEQNRFGGGALNPGGLKDDGKELLKWMDRHRTPVDLSHTSDQLAYDILNFIDQNQLKLPVIASHSNCRAVTDVVRNLPDELIKEVFKRNGIIGINFMREFIQKDSLLGFCRQLEHFLQLGGEDRVVMGADFFYGQDKKSPYYRPIEEQYHPECRNASCYPTVLKLWKNELKLSDEQINKIAHKNAAHFYKELSFTP